MTVKTLRNDIALTKIGRVYRKANGGQHIPNFAPWHKLSLVVLTYNPFPGLSNNAIRLVLGNVGFEISSKFNSQMMKFARREERDSVQRNYSLSLPGIAMMVGLQYNESTDTFSLNNPALARQVMISEIKGVQPLFDLFDEIYK